VPSDLRTPICRVPINAGTLRFHLHKKSTVLELSLDPTVNAISRTGSSIYKSSMSLLPSGPEIPKDLRACSGSHNPCREPPRSSTRLFTNSPADVGFCHLSPPRDLLARVISLFRVSGVLDSRSQPYVTANPEFPNPEVLSFTFRGFDPPTSWLTLVHSNPEMSNCSDPATCPSTGPTMKSSAVSGFRISQFHESKHRSFGPSTHETPKWNFMSRSNVLVGVNLRPSLS
jgi:hypothetical protein